jgi:tRNA1Val (adenine37-N6)-methyltransferase
VDGGRDADRESTFDEAHLDDLLTGHPLSFDALTADYAVYQRVGGHRFSSDDMATAWVAMTHHPDPSHVLDLGCGLGSVLLHLAWSAPDARLVGVEAQAISFALLQRNVAYNDVGHRVTVHHGDLRDDDVVNRLGGPFDLITGTPPYFGVDEAIDAQDEQRAYARIEYRGGVEAYTATAARLLAADGSFVVCGDADAGQRAHDAASANGLAITHSVEVIPRAGRPALFSVWVMRHQHAADSQTRQIVTLRDAQGERTADARALRTFSGFPTDDVDPGR